MNNNWPTPAHDQECPTWPAASRCNSSRATPATGSGARQGVTYIQRVATLGGVAPVAPCAAANLGARQIVKFQADYIFYKAM